MDAYRYVEGTKFQVFIRDPTLIAPPVFIEEFDLLEDAQNKAKKIGGFIIPTIPAERI